jgi:hypothetical protein
MMNVVVKLQGGMGNQMFQYAFGKKISVNSGRNLVLDRSFLLNKIPGPWNNYICRDYDLDIFNISNHSVVDQFNDDFFYVGETVDPHSDISQIDRLSESILKIGAENVYTDGYWASPRYFSDSFLFDEEFSVRKDLIMGNALSEEISQSNSVMINIRRTDFLNGNFHGVYGKDYILKCIEEIEKKEIGLKYYIFSDDLPWCYENLSDIPSSFIVDHSYKGDRFSNYLHLMTLCKHFIIPNSTFAWWAAFLSKNKDKRVFYPKVWLKGPGIETDFLVDRLNWECI